MDPLDGGRWVRVKLPRSALMMFGLSVNEEAVPERVQADVMLSHDAPCAPFVLFVEIISAMTA